MPGDVGYAANTNVIGHAGRTYALVEGGSLPYELTDRLGTVGPCDFEGTVPGGYTAHPHRDPLTGELHAISYALLSDDRVTSSVLGTDGRIRRSVDLEIPGNPLMHDFTLTENHVVVLDRAPAGACAGWFPPETGRRPPDHRCWHRGSWRGR